MAPKKKTAKRTQRQQKEDIGADANTIEVGDDSVSGDSATTAASTTQNNTSAHRPFMMAPPRLPTFSGEGDVTDFVEEAHRILSNCPMDDGVAVEWVLQALQGSARREVLDSLKRGVRSAEDILSVLQGTFEDRQTVTHLLANFYGMRQGSTSLLNFAQQLQQLGQRINRQRPGAIPDPLLRDQFLEGVANLDLRRELRRHLRDKPESTFLSVRAEAR